MVAGNLDDHHAIDIAVANFGTNSILVFQGSNDGNFTLIQSFSTGSSRPLMIALADLNNDHRLDIVVLNYGTNSVSIYVASESTSFVFLINYSTGYDSLPKSLAIADLNNDDQLDIVIANSDTNNIGLFFGFGNGTFADQTIYSTGIGSNPTSVTIGDANLDEFLDVIIANNGTSNIQILFGNQDGNYNKQDKYSTGLNSRIAFVSVHDLNGDNHPDIIALDSKNERLYVLQGNENSTFPLLSIYVADSGSGPISLGGSDFDYDNRTDILVVNQGANNLLMLREYSVGSTVSYSTSFINTPVCPNSIITADFNSDNLLDIIVNNWGSNLIVVYFGKGDGSFTLHSTLSTGIESWTNQLVSGDFNNDHQLDIAVLNPANNSFSIFFGYGNGNFSTATTYSTETVLNPISSAVGDVNNDNCSDIVILGFDSYNVGIYIGHCNGIFELTLVYNISDTSKPYRITIDDFNMDNNADLVITHVDSEFIRFYFGDGTGRFLMFPVLQPNKYERLLGMASGDFNNDNRTDLAVSGYVSNVIVIFLGYRNGTFDDIKSYSIESCKFASSIAIGDFNGDSQLDSVVCCSYSKTIAIFLGNDHGDLVQQQTYSTSQNSDFWNFILGDFNNDNKLDIAIADRAYKIGVFMNYYKADFAIQSIHSTGSSPQPYALAVADFNNDNISDLVIANSGTKNIAARLGFGNGSFGMETILPMASTSFPWHVNVGDLNRDGLIDIVIADSESDSIIINFGNGDGTFGRTFTYLMGFQSKPTWVDIAYVNNDPWLDLVVANHGTDSLGILYGYNYGTFTLHQTYSNSYKSGSRVVLVADMNNDTRLDIIVANQHSDSIGIYLGHGNGNFADQITYSIGKNSSTRSIAIADMNSDGFGSISIILADGNGTLGIMITQTMEPGSGSSAVTVGDVNNDNRLDVIVADDLRNKIDVFLGFGNGSLLPITTYSTGSGSKPSSVVVQDLNHDNCVDIVVIYRGFDSVGILYGYGNGSFAPQITHWLRRGSYLLSVDLGDFNNDKKIDIAVISLRFGSVDIFFGFGNGSFSQPKSFLIDSRCIPSIFIVNYFNDDDRADIAVFCANDGSFSILYGTEEGSFSLGRKHLTIVPLLLIKQWHMVILIMIFTWILYSIAIYMIASMFFFGVEMNLLAHRSS